MNISREFVDHLYKIKYEILPEAARDRAKYFLLDFLDLLDDDKNLILIEDEVGFGTSSLRKYAYSKVG